MMNPKTPDPVTWIMNCIVDFTGWLFPGKLGWALKTLVAWFLFLGLLYFEYRDTIQK
jgi:hypothetical protein